MKRTRNLTVLILGLLFVFSLMGVTAFAADADPIELPENLVKEEIVVDVPGVGDNDELLYSYMQDSVSVSFEKKYSVFGRDHLTGLTLQAYQLLRPMIKEVADGTEHSTEFHVSVSRLGLSGKFTAADLGVSSIVSNGAISQAAKDAMYAKFDTLNLNRLVSALLFDCPYDLYWFDKTAGTQLAYPSISAQYDSGTKQYVIFFNESTDLCISYAVAQEYAAGIYATDPEKIEAVQTTVETVQQIVTDNEGKSDLEKLKAYKDRICALVSYNTAAASNSSTAYGNPWQLIWVFDNDTSTNVVCEGYSKAFQFLCDASSFASDKVKSRIVTGTMSGGTGAHMWNVVTFEDGYNYLVDVTNCDTGSIGATDQLFLALRTPTSVTNGYVIACRGGNIRYVYDEDTLESYSEEELAVADTQIESGTFQAGDLNENLSWTVTNTGKLTVSGTGDIPQYENGAPWIADRDRIKQVVIGEGITSIADYTFTGYHSLRSVSLPDSLKKIGASAFDSCEQLKEAAIPDGVTEIGEKAFYDCDALTVVAIPSKVATIGQYAFAYCNNLKQIVFTGNAPQIGLYAFSDRSYEAFYPGNDPTWTEQVRQGYGGDVLWTAYDPDTTRFVMDAAGLYDAASEESSDGNAALTIVVVGNIEAGESIETNHTIVIRKGLGLHVLDGVRIASAINNYGSISVESGGQLLTAKGNDKQIHNYGVISVAKGAALRTQQSNRILNNGRIDLNGDFYCGCIENNGEVQTLFTNTGEVYWGGPDCRVYLFNAVSDVLDADDVSSLQEQMNAALNAGMETAYEYGVYVLLHHDGVAATCEGSGNKEYWSCNETYYSDAEGLNPVAYDSLIISPLGHDYQDVAGTAVASTCSKSGKQADKKCSRCKDVIEGAALPLAEHNWNTNFTVDKKATCSAEGSESIHCSVCNAIKDGASRTIKKIAHRWNSGKVTKPATAVSAGVRTYTCTVCGSKKTATIKRLTPTIKLSVKAKTIKRKQSFVLAISKLAKGDSVKSLVVSKKGIVKIKKAKTNTYKITGIKRGKTIITVVLKSGKKAACVVKVK